MKFLDLPLTNIQELIPQKFPFVMVDALLEYSKLTVVSSFKILKENIFFENNTLSEAGLIENMAQTIALHSGYDYFLKGEKAPMGYIGSIKKIEILMLPTLNETITTQGTILQEFMGITLVELKVLNDNNDVLAYGEMKTVIVSNG
jgi:predicted hotdog family 3-hydroxylacyl-ACP dehydratase